MALSEPRIVSAGHIAEKISFGRSSQSERGKTIFFIGAGCSVTAGIPGAAAIAKQMVKEVGSRFSGDCPDEIMAYKALVKKKRFEACPIGDPKATADDSAIDWHKVYDGMFRRHYTAPDDVRDLFARLVEQSKGAVNWAHLCLGEIVAQGHASTILTTNFDQLVLAGLVRAGVLPVICDGIESLNRIAGAPRHPQLVELHGSRHTYLLRNAPEDVKAVRENSEASAAIQKLFQHATTFVVVGYGGREEGVMQLLLQAAKVYRDKNIFWVNHSPKPGEIAADVKEFLSTSRNSGLLPGQDADTFFLALCRELEIGSPTSICKPLTLIERGLSEASQCSIADSDIRDEIDAALRYLQRLKKSGAGHEANRTEEIVAAIRTKRLAGDHADAYRIALKSTQRVRQLRGVDPRILKELGLTALEHGQHSPDPSVLEKAFGCFSLLFEKADKKTLDHGRWASRMGEALWRLAERDPDGARFKEAAALLRSALRKIGRRTAPLEWAATQNHLGNALLGLAEREKGTANLSRALAAYRAALEERTRDRVPLDWAATQNNLGNALSTLGERKNAVNFFVEAVAAYRAALEEYTRERVPLDWAMTQNNLGDALSGLAALEGESARLNDAVSAFRFALSVYTRKETPLDWAMTKNNLGIAFRSLAEHNESVADLERSVKAHEDALKEYKREVVPLDWAMTTINISVSRILLAERWTDCSLAEAAIEHLSAARALLVSGGHAYNVSICDEELAKARGILLRVRDK